jgi:2,5-diamino-6-(ribosylamino)-4(3H)-pyrimidinone 5'-phosphate reductase
MHINSEEEMIRLNLKKYYLCGSNLVSEFDVLYTGGDVHGDLY